MELTVFGANGGTGRALVLQALAQGHVVRAVTRHPDQLREQLGESGESLQIVCGDVTDVVSVGRSIRGSGAVLSALGVPFTRQPVTLYSTSMANILGAMRSEGVRRLVAVTSSAADPTAGVQGKFLTDRVVTPLVLRLGRTGYDDERRLEALVEASGDDVAWTVMRPAALFDRGHVGEYDVSPSFIPGQFTARDDLAAAMLDELARHDHHGKKLFIVSNHAAPNLLKIIWTDAIRKG